MNKKQFGMKFDYTDLKALVHSRGMTIRELAQKCGMHENLLYRKLTNMNGMTHEDMVVISATLGLSQEEMGKLLCTVKDWGTWGNLSTASGPPPLSGEAEEQLCCPHPLSGEAEA